MINISEYLTTQTLLPPFLPYPRFLLELDLSQTAKMTYVLLLDRATLSQKNLWIDAKLYEDVSKGLLPEKRFQMLADRYDKEQAELTEKIEQYEREGRAEHDQLDKIQDFIDEVSKYAGITELNYKILHQLIDKILVSKAEKVDGEYVQKIQIFYRFIGPLDAIE